jgi:hypothetical protein
MTAEQAAKRPTRKRQKNRSANAQRTVQYAHEVMALVLEQTSAYQETQVEQAKGAAKKKAETTLKQITQTGSALVAGLEQASEAFPAFVKALGRV